MKLRQQWHQNKVGAFLSILLSVGSGLFLWDIEFSFSKALKHISYDQPFLTRSQTIPDDIILVYLDDKSHQDLQQPYTAPWDRTWHTKLIERATQEGAKAIMFDIVFSDPSPDGPAVDNALAKAIEENGNVILAADLVKSELGGESAHKFLEVVTPYEPFDFACADIGFSSLKLDSDLTVREHFHIDTSNELIDSLTWATARHLGIAEALQDDKRTKPRWVNYYGPPRTIPYLSFSDVVGQSARTENLFKDKIVYVGAHLQTYNSGERKDEFVSPWSAWDLSGDTWRFIAGVEVHATILLNLLHNEWISEIPKRIQLVYFILFGAMVGGGLVFMRPLAASLAAVILAVLVVLTAHYLHWVHRLWFPWAISVAAQIPIAWAFTVAFNSIKLYVQKQLLEQSIRAYLSPKLVKAFASRSDENFLKPGAKKQHLSILFSDIEGFTSLSEGMDSSDLANLMNGYFEATVSNGIHATDGTVVKYIGDAIFAFWNAPEPQSDHATRACEAAVQIQLQPYEFSESKPINTRIGIHTGTADVGNFGSANRVDYTAIGENINLAARLEGLNKYLSTRTLISIETRNAADSSIVTRDLGYFRLKGFERTVQVLELIGVGDEVRDSSLAYTGVFAEALAAFQNRDFSEAQAKFTQILALKPNDGPSMFYLKQIDVLHVTPPADDWQGEVELAEK